MKKMNLIIRLLFSAQMVILSSMVLFDKTLNFTKEELIQTGLILTIGGIIILRQSDND